MNELELNKAMNMVKSGVKNNKYMTRYQLLRQLKGKMTDVTEMLVVSDKSSKDVVLSLDKLVSAALREKHMGATMIQNFHYEAQKDEFEQNLVRSARITKSGKPEVVSKILVDVNEKIYTNLGSGQKGDETKVTIVKKSESSEAYGYEQKTTSGLEWGAGTNLGAQFGLPQVGVGASGGFNASFKKYNEKSKTNSTTKTSTIGQESHHEEEVEVPPGHKVSDNDIIQSAIPAGILNAVHSPQDCQHSSPIYLLLWSVFTIV